MRWGSLFSLDSVVKARPHEFAMLFGSIRRPGRAVEGGKRYQMAAYTSVRPMTVTVDISKAVNHRESAFLAPGRHDRMTGGPEHNPAQGLFLFGDACEPHSRPMGDQRPPQKSPPGSCATASALVDHSPTPRVPSDPHRSSTIDVPENQPLQLAPTATAWRAGPPRAPGVRSRSRGRRASLTHTAQTTSASSTDWRQLTPEVEPIVAVHANILSPTGPGIATEPPRYRGVATAPRPALIPNIARLCRFPGRETGSGAQRGFCRPPII